MMNLWIRATIVCILLLDFSGCANREKQAPKPDTIRIAVPYELDGLDPHSKAWLSQYAVTGNFYEPLVGTDENSKIEPRLAASWENPDASTWIFHLQRSVRFQNGKNFQAEDVVFTLNRLLKNNTLAVSSYLTDVIEVTELDPFTVKVRTRTPLAIFLNKLNNVLIVPRGTSDAMLKTEVDGTGPYRLAEFRSGEFVRMVRNENYWGKKPDLKHVTYFLNRTPEVAAKDLMEGRCQFAQYNFKKMEARVRALGNFEIIRKDNYFLKYLSYDVLRDVTPYCSVKPNPFKNDLVRKAIHLGIDRQRLVEQLPTYAVPATQPVPPYVFGFNPKIPAPEYNPEKARALLAQAGLPAGFEVGFFVRQILAETGSLISQQLAAIGIRLQMKVFPDSEFFKMLDQKDASFFLTRVGATVGDASDILEPQLHTRVPQTTYGVRNYVGYSNPEVDRTIKESAGLLKIEERREALERIMWILMEDLPWIPLYIDQDVYALEKSFKWKPRHDSNIFAYEIGFR